MKFKIIYADPPWSYNNGKSKLGGLAENAYTVATDEDIASWDVGKIADKDSLLFLWATFPKIDICLNVLKAWGFKYVTAPFVWNKTYTNGNPFCGVGFWSRCGAEVVLLGRKGKGLKRIVTAERQVVTAPVTRPHSSKPPEIRDRIIKLVGDHPRIELFARQKTPGWFATGLESDGRTLEAAIEHYHEF